MKLGSGNVHGLGMKFLSAVPSDLPLAEEINHLSRIGLAIFAICILGIGAWMSLAPLAGAVISPGIVKVDMDRKTIQHFEGGIVSEIRVRNGDHVQAGEVLIVLGDVRVDAGLALIRTQLDAERARYARLSAEATLSKQMILPADLIARSQEAKIAEIVKREGALFSTRRNALETQTELLRKQIRQANEEADALSQQIAAEERALALQQDELQANRELLRNNFVQKTRVLGLERAAADYEVRLGEHKAELAKTRQRATELELRILSLKNSYMQNAADNMRESNGHLLEMEEKLRPSRDAADRQNIVSPQAGEIVDLRIKTLGAAIGAREPLMDIVPSDGRLIIEGRMKPDEINYVRVGGRVGIHLTAYKNRTTPMVEGRVTYVSADRLLDRITNTPYYEFHVDVTKEALRDAGNLKLQAGMPAELFVSTGERTAMDYLLDPFVTYVRRAFREP